MLLLPLPSISGWGHNVSRRRLGGVVVCAQGYKVSPISISFYVILMSFYDGFKGLFVNSPCVLKTVRVC